MFDNLKKEEPQVYSLIKITFIVALLGPWYIILIDKLIFQNQILLLISTGCLIAVKVLVWMRKGEDDKE